MLKHLREYIDFDNYDIDETDNQLTDKMFVKFLKDNKIYDRFINNLHRAITNHDEQYENYWYSIGTFCNDINKIYGISQYMILGFNWRGTPEGSDFWNYWYKKWKHYIKNI